MKLSHVTFSNVHGVADRHVDLVSGTTGRPHDLFVVSGPPASGKTRLLEAVLAALETVGPYMGIVRGHEWAKDRAKSARVDLGFWLNEEEQQLAPLATAPARAVVSWSAGGIGFEADRGLARLLERYDHDVTFGKREYFAENRQLAWGARVDGTSPLEQSLHRSSKDPQKYGFVPRFLAALRTSPERAQSFARVLEILSPTVRYAPNGASVDTTAYFSSRGGKPAYLSELSSSEANAVLIAATAIMIGLHHSIILLDRPELYVHPDRVVSWIRALSEIGTDNQWIVATGDSRIVAAVDPSQRLLLSPHASLGRAEPS